MKSNKMNTLKKSLNIVLIEIILFSTSLSFQGCWDELEWNSIPKGVFLQISEKDLNFDFSAVEYFLEIKCNEEYNFSLSNNLQSWCNVEKDKKGDLILSISENTEKKKRSGEIYIQSTSKMDTISISQLGWPKDIVVSQSSFIIDSKGGEFELKVTANTDYEFNFGDCDWITEKTLVETQEHNSHELVTESHYFTVNSNNESSRTVTVEVNPVNNDLEVKGAVFTVLQKGVDDIKEDVKILVNSVTGDGGQGTNGKHQYDLMIDGNPSLDDPQGCWQNDWKNPKFPQYIEFTFNEPQNIDYMIYYPSDSGHFKNIEVEVLSSDNQSGTNEYKNIYTGQMEESKQSTRIDFSETQLGVIKVKIIIKDTYKPNVARCCELEFYKKNID